MADLTSNILAVIVLYQKTVEKSRSFQSIKALHERGMEILFYDNSPSSQNVADSLYYQHEPGNAGVSGAYNFAARKAREMGKEWLWLLDDDTLVDAEFLNQAWAFIEDREPLQLFVPKVYSHNQLLSPFRLDRSFPFRLEHINTGTHSLRRFRPINSGMLISLKAFEKAGGYSTELPLDFSDIEFTDRLAKVLPQFHVSAIRFEQQFSGDEKPPLGKAKQRFAKYLKAASVYSKKAAFPRNVQKQALRRALRLSLQYFSPYFITLYYQTSFRP